MESVRSVRQSTAHKANRAAILAVDYGRARIGLAIADAETRMAQPLSTLERINRNEDMRRVRELVREHAVRQIVVGLPLRLDGTRGEMAEEVERFAQRVRKQIGVPVEMVDERLTSWEAERLMEEVQGRFIHDKKLTGNKKPKNVQAKMTDRKSTRLNSSHGYISYAVFCLKKKNTVTAASSRASSAALESTPSAALPPRSAPTPSLTCTHRSPHTPFASGSVSHRGSLIARA